MNSNGYTIKEMVILAALLAVVLVISISKVSYAYSISARESEGLALKRKVLENATYVYVNNNKDKFTEKETFIYGSELIENNLLFESDDTNYSVEKIKVTNDNGEYKVEIVS